MAHIKISKGLDIPIKGKPQGEIQTLHSSGSSIPTAPKQLALNVTAFEGVKFKVLVNVGETVKIGQPLLEDKSSPGRMFCSPAAGVVAEVRRGHRRVIKSIVIDVAAHEEHYRTEHASLEKSSAAELIEAFKLAGIFAHIRVRPFNRLADPSKQPRSIFVKALESAPFAPPAELQVLGHEKEFQIGLDALAKLTSGPVHLIYRKDSPCSAFTEAKNVQRHTAEGPHPIGTASVHIQYLDPIKSTEDVIWTVDVHDVIAIGHFISTGHYLIERVISIAGPGILPDRVGYYRVREGMPVAALVSGRLPVEDSVRLISGDPLMGQKVEADDFLGFDHFVFCAIPENNHREFLHFFGVGKEKYSFSKAYLSGHLNNTHREYDFTTNQHGEHRAFIDSTLYDEVMPLPISTMTLVKAVMAEDYDLAAQLGLMTVDSEDFALPTFVCQSKIEMSEIIKEGLRQYAHDVLS